MKSLLFIGFVVIVSTACSVSKYATTNKMYKKKAKSYAKDLTKSPADSTHTAPFWAGTTNFNMRKANFVIIHHTAQNSCDQTLKTFTLERTAVSSHYVICKDGTVHHMLNDHLRAWHGGNSRWGNLTDLNSASIGIELDNNGFESFAEPQITSLLKLLGQLKRAHGVPIANFIGHSDIAPRRKVDPNVTFPWKRLSDQGFGLWYDDTTNVKVPEHFNVKHALRIIGYDVSDSAAAMQAFKRHWVQDTIKVVNEADRKILYKLSQKF
jgi:N-acetylmuramoyl-L-alanine amidase